MKNKILFLYKKGLSYREIQKKLGCSKGTISYHCGVGQKEKTRKRARDKRGELKKYIQEYKQGKKCVDCREDYPYWILEFDHLKDKKFTIGAFYNYTNSLLKLKKEIEKCDVVCANCHKNRTYKRLFKNESNILDMKKYY